MIKKKINMGSKPVRRNGSVSFNTNKDLPSKSKSPSKKNSKKKRVTSAHEKIKGPK